MEAVRSSETLLTTRFLGVTSQGTSPNLFTIVTYFLNGGIPEMLLRTGILIFPSVGALKTCRLISRALLAVIAGWASFTG